MEKIVIFGAGGFGREVAFLIKQINQKSGKKWDLIGFIDDNAEILGTLVNGIPVIGNGQYLIDHKENLSVIIALCHKGKDTIIKTLLNNKYLSFPNILWPDLIFDDTNMLGVGNIICHGAYMTCNIEIGNFNIFNGCTGLGHDVKIGDYNLFGPNSFIAGEVKIGDSNIFTMNVSVLQQKKIGNGNTINLNSVIIRNIDDNGTYFGVPATKQTF